MLKLIIPDWNDIVDPNYNFITESFSEEYKQDKFNFGVRIWHLINPPPIEGVLVSRSMLEYGSRISKIVKAGGIREFLKLDKNLEVIGDCGAWQYVNLKDPPYGIINTLEFYEKIKVDYGVTVDHIAVIRDPEYRMQLTYKNAIKSFEKWKKKFESSEYNFILLGAVQGVEISDYVKYVKKLYEKGYRHFAIGGLAKRKTGFIERLISQLHRLFKELRKTKRVHFLGVARPGLARCFSNLLDVVDEVSFDNATYLRMAWMRTVGNYLMPNGRIYTAIRVRRGSREEKKILSALRSYAEGRISYSEIVGYLKEYLATNGEIKYLPYCIPTLRDRPWEKCRCPICQKWGIEVLIFRGNDRNRRRGFHNLWVYRRMLENSELLRRPPRILVDKGAYQMISLRDKFKVFYDTKSLSPNSKNLRKVAIITYCTREKSVDMLKVQKILRSYGLNMPRGDLEHEEKYKKILGAFIKPAEEVYSGSFKYVRRLANVLRKNGVKTDVYIVSARYGLIRGDTKIVPYDYSLEELSKNELKDWLKSREILEKLYRILNDNNYDLIIVNLTKTYAAPLKPFLEDVFKRSNVIMLLPSARILKSNNIKAQILSSATLRRRIHWLSMLAEYFKMKNQLEIVHFLEKCDNKETR